MSYFEKRCPNCGATFIEGDAYCRTCNTPLEYQPISQEAMLEGIKKSDWHLFIDKNSSRYVNVFSKNEGKKVFLNMNWAAMFFNIYWMFYRKMYKYAIIYLIISTVFSITLSALVLPTIKSDILEAQKILEPHNQYLDNSNDLYSAYPDGSVVASEILNLTTPEEEYDNAIDAIMRKWAFRIIVPSIIFNVIFGLLADCIYRRYILRNINYKRGGTSGWSLACGVIIYGLINNIIVSPIVTYIFSKILQ